MRSSRFQKLSFVCVLALCLTVISGGIASADESLHPSTTVLPSSSVNVGTAVQDSAIMFFVGSDPTGAAVNFQVFANGGCTGSAIQTDTGVAFAISPSTGQPNEFEGQASSSTFTPTAPGSYSYLATFPGFNAYPGIVFACEPFTVIGHALGNQGCTPGFWKNSKHFSLWTGYAPTQTVNSVFSVPATFPDGSDGSSLANATLAGALSFKGGSDLNGAAQILLRAATSALLNASNPNVAYSMTTSQIVSSVNTALASGSRDQILNLATTLDNANNGAGGCPLS